MTYYKNILREAFPIRVPIDTDTKTSVAAAMIAVVESSFICVGICLSSVLRGFSMLRRVYFDMNIGNVAWRS